MVRNIFDIAVVNHIVTAATQAVANQRLQVIFTAKQTVIHSIIIAFKIDPVVPGFKGWRVVIYDCGVGKPTVSRFKTNYLLILFCKRSAFKANAIHDNIRCIEQQFGSTGKYHGATIFGTDDYRRACSAGLIEVEDNVSPNTVCKNQRISRPRRCVGRLEICGSSYGYIFST